LKLYFRICVAYAVVVLVAIFFVRDTGPQLWEEAAIVTIAFGKLMLGSVKWFVAVAILMPFFVGLRRVGGNIAPAAYAVAASVLFQAMFSLMKSSIRFFVPFYADPPLAAFDKWLHGGTDPWVWRMTWHDTCRLNSSCQSILRSGPSRPSP